MSRSAKRRPNAAVVVAPPAPGWRSQDLLVFAAFLAIALVCYWPALHGGMLWDDAAHVTPVEMRSLDGLRGIWFDVGATQQYYPLTYSAFWLQAQLWGDQLVGHHLVNVALHALCAFLVVMVLRRLDVRGAVLAGVLFLVHPIEVESVAWITELKNTLSGVFYLAAALMYLRFRRDGRATSYGWALGLFACSLFSKTVTATLPAGLLVIVWWQEGRLAWRRDIVPLVPFFVLGACAGVLTAWVEHDLLGAYGAEYDLNLVERTLVAGRAFVFYLCTLAWPSNLSFIYPRWPIDASAWWQYLYPLTVAALLATAWWLRGRSRAPLAALLYFGVTLAPALGFVNVYPFRYSFVADHFQYLAGVGIIALASGALATAIARWRPARATAFQAIALVAMAVPLGSVARAESARYVDVVTLYEETLVRNPQCWLCYQNLGVLSQDGSEAGNRRAIDLYQRAIAINPDDAPLHDNLGTALHRIGRPGEALKEHETAIRLAPEWAGAHVDRGADLQKMGRFAEAVPEYQEALRLDPTLETARFNLGVMLMVYLNRPEEAAVQFRDVIRVDPTYPDVQRALADALKRAEDSGRAGQ